MLYIFFLQTKILNSLFDKIIDDLYMFTIIQIHVLEKSVKIAETTKKHRLWIIENKLQHVDSIKHHHTLLFYMLSNKYSVQ